MTCRLSRRTWLQTTTTAGLAAWLRPGRSCAARTRSAWALAPFAADVTIPLGHRCMGILPTKARRVLDPLEARGFVLLGPGKPLVVVSVDWCEIRNRSFELWRSQLARAAGTDPQYVLLSSVHQHDAPVVDHGAQELLDAVGLKNELFDPQFHRQALQRTVAALEESLRQPQPVTHLGLGRGRVQHVASNRRVVHPDGRVDFSRGSGSGSVAFYREAPEGEIDPWLRTLSFWHQERPLLGLHVYATHPMSIYGRGEVSADFPGVARRLRQKDQPKVFQMYASGCSGDVTAGKYNDRSPRMRRVLGRRLHQGMVRSWQATRRVPLEQMRLQVVPLRLPFRRDEPFTAPALRRVLENPRQPQRNRILAAMSLATRKRLQEQPALDFPCVELGPARLLLFPGETFVGYQLLAQRMAPEQFVVCLGYGECWPCYVPTRAAQREGFVRHSWQWVAEGCDRPLLEAMERVLEAREAG